MVLIGEAPGENEDLQGIPFCGSAGKELDIILNLVGIDDFIILNVLKCRPPENRDPLKEEIEACGGWLDKQLDIIKPKLIVLMGKSSIRKFFPEKKNVTMRNLRGRFFNNDDYNNIKFFVTYHPASILYDRKKKDFIIKDFKKIKNEI